MYNVGRKVKFILARDWLGVFLFVLPVVSVMSTVAVSSVIVSPAEGWNSSAVKVSVPLICLDLHRYECYSASRFKGDSSLLCSVVSNKHERGRSVH